MPDLCKTEYKCLYCDKTSKSIQEIKQHITDSREGQHKTVDGFQLDTPIPTVDSNKLGETLNVADIEQRIRRRAKDKGFKTRDGSDNKLLDEIAAEANTDTSHVFRVLEDSGYEVRFSGQHPPTAWEDLTSRQQSALSLAVELNTVDPEEIASGQDYYASDIAYVIRRYGWLCANKYYKGSTDDYEGNVSVEDTTDELLNSIGSVMGDTLREQENGTAEPESVAQASTAENLEETQQMTDTDSKEVSVLKALDDCNIEYDISIGIRQDEFKAIEDLISSGHSDVAKQLFNDEF